METPINKLQPQILLESVIPTMKGPLEEVAEMEPTSVQCPVCLKEFKSATSVAIHKGLVHKPKPKPEPKVDLVEHPMFDYPPTQAQLSRQGMGLSRQGMGRPVTTLDTRRKKWSLARRRKFNATVRRKKESGWSPVPPENVTQEPVAMIRFCPFCSKSLERFLT